MVFSRPVALWERLQTGHVVPSVLNCAPDYLQERIEDKLFCGRSPPRGRGTSRGNVTAARKRAHRCLSGTCLSGAGRTGPRRVSQGAPAAGRHHAWWIQRECVFGTSLGNQSPVSGSVAEQTSLLLHSTIALPHAPAAGEFPDDDELDAEPSSPYSGDEGAGEPSKRAVPEGPPGQTLTGVDGGATASGETARGAPEVAAEVATGAAVPVQGLSPQRAWGSSQLTSLP